MPINPSIAMSYRGVELPQQNALADYAAIQQIQSGQRQAEVSQMQLESLRRDQAALAKMQAAITAKGGPADLNTAADEMIKSGIPEYLKQGLTIKQTLDKQARFASLLGPTGGAAAPAAAPASEAYPGYNESIGMTNALAPAPAAAAPSVNAMANRINQAYAIGTPEALAWAKAREEEMKPMTVSPGASVYQGGKSVFTAPAAAAAPPSMVGEYTFAKTPEGGNFRGSYQDFVVARAAATRAPRPEAAPRTQQVTMSDGSLGIVNMDTGVITPSTVGGAAVKGKPSAFAEKAAAQKAQMGKDVNLTIKELTDAVKDGGLIDQSTGSGAGALADIAAGFVGKATPGAIAVGKLAPIADLTLKMVPRFEGPQSDKDTMSYKQAAGQLANPSLPNAIRKEAGKTVLRLMQERKNQFASSDAAPAGVAPPAGFTPD